MRPTPRTQPYRRGAPRMPGMVLNAMLGGRAQGMVNPADFARQRLALGAGRPQAMTDVRDFAQQVGHPPVPSVTTGDNFGGVPTSLHPDDRLQALLQQRIRPRATTDIRNRRGFGAQQGALQQLILQSLLAPHRVV